MRSSLRELCLRHVRLSFIQEHGVLLREQMSGVSDRGTAGYFGVLRYPRDVPPSRVVLRRLLGYRARNAWWMGTVERLEDGAISFRWTGQLFSLNPRLDGSLQWTHRVDSIPLVSLYLLSLWRLWASQPAL